MNISLGNYLRICRNPSKHKEFVSKNLEAEVQKYFCLYILPYLYGKDTVKVNINEIGNIYFKGYTFLNQWDFYSLFYGCLCIKILQLGYKPTNFSGFGNCSEYNSISYTSKQKNIKQYKEMIDVSTDFFDILLKEEIFKLGKNTHIPNEFKLGYSTFDIERLRHNRYQKKLILFDDILLFMTAFNLFKEDIFVVNIRNIYDRCPKEGGIQWKYFRFDCSLTSTINAGYNNIFE